MWYMDSANAITEGPVTLKGDVMEVFFNGQDFEGRAADLRVKVTRKGNDFIMGCWPNGKTTDGNNSPGSIMCRKQK